MRQGYRQKECKAVILNRVILSGVRILEGKNRAGSWGKTKIHGFRRTIHDGNRHVMTTPSLRDSDRGTLVQKVIYDFNQSSRS